jgi:hypothetical protein
MVKVIRPSPANPEPVLHELGNIVISANCPTAKAWALKLKVPVAVMPLLVVQLTVSQFPEPLSL